MRAFFLKRVQTQFKKLMTLKKSAEHDKMFRVARRCHGILLNMDLQGAPKIANVLNVSRAQVSKWLRDYRHDGIESVYEGYRPGAPSRISNAQTRQLKKIIIEGPLKNKLETGVWTSTNVAEIIKRKFAVAYHPGHVRKLLHKIGCSVQRPKARNYKADEEKRKEWLTGTFPGLKKKRWYRMR